MPKEKPESDTKVELPDKMTKLLISPNDPENGEKENEKEDPDGMIKVKNDENSKEKTLNKGMEKGKRNGVKKTPNMTKNLFSRKNGSQNEYRKPHGRTNQTK